MQIRYFITTILLVCFAASAYAQVEKAEAEIQNIMKELNVVGLSVAVVKNNEIIYTHAFGQKDIEKNIPLQENDVFRIASISKSFCATSIMQLAEARKLSLDDDFSDLVGFKVRNPKYPETVITLKMVMSHTSSINDSQGYFNLDAINPAKGGSWEKCYSDYAPGKGYRYCNLNYNMVGAVIERLSGERIDTYVKRHILDPLGLYGGYNTDSLDSARFSNLYEDDRAVGKYTTALTYVLRKDGFKDYQMGYSTPQFSPTGGMKISAPDLAKYMTMHMNYGKYKKTRIISKRSSKLMQTKVSDDEAYGLALWTSDNLIPGKAMKGHTGSAYGLYSAMFFHPREKFGIVVITNGCDPGYTNGMNTVLRKTINSLYTNLIK
ncbi:serine hydrolase domain-containing protein [Pedobacter psychroterrae]|uniref:Class A beta-lactamase-related serine hydrolase n=1 Tax=Pedobacter psychroterrae TaxID=2530453 RepID=A0A4R0NJR8_9SPHI|nr:serine hydrolase domain-containing protein [Pedobacter psychroterrae]TCD00970.1 class A beta-lactamase-related serine hydrolase [Pedobacter psychroterrae]